MAVLEARKLKKMDITGASDPYVKIKLFDNKVSLETEENENLEQMNDNINKIIAYLMTVTIPISFF